jgi:hypothetical protein
VIAGIRDFMRRKKIAAVAEIRGSVKIPA